MQNKSQIILFQGDSITDCGRDKSDPNSLGGGYPSFLSGILPLKNPDTAYVFLNRAVSADRIVDLYARLKEDIINLKPDILSILIGINDVWHEFASKQGVGSKKFKKIFAMLLDEVREEMPGVKIVLLEPFILRAGAPSESYDGWNAEMRVRREIVSDLAKQYSAVFVPLQDEFDRLSEKHAPEFWARDGVHPTSAGHMAIAYRWTERVLE